MHDKTAYAIFRPYCLNKCSKGCAYRKQTSKWRLLWRLCPKRDKPKLP